MTKFRTRLLFALITLIFIVLICLGIILGQLFKGYYIDSFDERLKKETRLVSTYIQDNGGVTQISSAKLEFFSNMLDSRVTLLDRYGSTVFDSGVLDKTDNSKHKQTVQTFYKNKANELDDTVEVGEDYNLHYYGKKVILNDQIDGVLIISSKLTEIKKAYQQIWWILTISLGFALFVIILLGYRIMTRYTKPIESATNVAMELARGNYRARTYEEHIDETGMLSSAINVLARNLQELMKSQEIQQDRLGTLIENMGSGLILIDSRGFISLVNRTYKEIFNISTEDHMYKLYYEVVEHREITDIIEEIFMTEQKVRKQLIIGTGMDRKHFEVYGIPIIGTNDVWKGILLVFHDISEIKRLESMRKDFVANVSHELKTPVTSIKGFSETLLDGAMDDRETLESFLNIILKESDRLQSLIQDLLDLSKIEQHSFHLELQQVPLLELVNEVLMMLSEKAKKKQVQLTIDDILEDVTVEGDYDRLKQVFINLLSNAVLYTPAGGSVHISMKVKAKTVQVRIKDTGIGIEEKEIPRIFERFYRVDRARSRNSGGTGLGLAIVKHLVEAHKGAIFVKSTIGVGTTFTIELLKKFPSKYRS